MASWLVSSVLTISESVAKKIRQSLPSSSSTSADPRNAIEEDLEKLERTLKWIRARLHDAEEREIRDEFVKHWLTELRGLAYEAEDVLDEYHYEVQRSEAEARAAAAKATRKRKLMEEGEEEDLQVGDSISHFFSSSKISIPDSMGDKIREIRSRFDEIAKERNALQLRPGDGERRLESQTYPSPSGYLVDDSEVFGREDDKKKVMDLLLFSNNGCHFSVIPIVGFGGLGKTTLAQLVYNDPKICRNFDLQGWVSVSVDFDAPGIMRGIIESITKNPCSLTELSTLQHNLRKEVEGKSVLLVMDDVWNDKSRPWSHVWEPLKVALKVGKWVRVIVTTRDSQVAGIMQAVEVQTLDVLAEDQCRMLFRRWAFSSAEKPEAQLVEIGDKIVKKCAGLPLAVKVLGSMLRGETAIEMWEDVLQSDLWEQGEDVILPALRLSYHRLPTCLKPCFVYCSMYPKSHEFDKDELIMLWMAQGYIQPSGRRSLEDIGSEYFDQLLRRSFFQIRHIYETYKEEDFVMHDLLVDLAQSISREEWCTTSSTSSRGVGHLYETKKHLPSPSHCEGTTFLRTLLINQMLSFDTTIPTIMKSPNLEYLRALRWVRSEWLTNSNSIGIGRMKHLRCLGLHCSSVLPEWLHQLYNLQTLELIQPIGLEVNGIGDLINLRHLSLPWRNFGADESIEKLTNLRTLSGFNVTRRTRIGVLKGMVELRKLHLTCKYEGVVDNEQLVAAALENLQPQTNLKDLHISCYAHGGVRLPSWMGNPSFSKLTHVYISCWRTGNIVLLLPSLGRLSALRCLTLEEIHGVVTIGQEFRCCVQDHHNNATTTEEAAAYKVVGFPSLKELKFENLYDWEEWDGVQDGDFPHLESLKIASCDNLMQLPTVPLLQSRTLHITGCSKLSSINLQQYSGRPSRLKELHIGNCENLTSMMGLHTVDSLQVLKVKSSPYPREDVPSNVRVVDLDIPSGLSTQPKYISHPLMRKSLARKR